MYVKRGKCLMVLAVMLLLVPFLSSCNLLSLIIPGSPDDDSDPETTIPDDVIELADGVFNLIGTVFENIDDPLHGEYPDGMSVSGADPDIELTLTFTDFSPPDDSLVLVNGEITLTKTSLDASPLTIMVTGTLALSNYAFTTVTLDGAAAWATADADPAVDQPESFTGTFTVDGVDYLIADILAAIEAADEDETPDDYSPLPAIFMTSAGNYSQNFNAKVWRPSPAFISDSWAGYTYITFNINDDGTRHTYYAGSETPMSGCLDWHTDGEVQKLDMLDANGDPLFSFTVLDWSSCHLHLVGGWGDETKEWIFSAGKDVLSGVVVDNDDSVTIEHYPYNKPISGVLVQLGTQSEDMMTFSPIPGATAMTDERGYFEFDDISAYVGQYLGVELTKEGYEDIQSPIPPDRLGVIGPGEQYFGLFLMNPVP